jgi:hypothetical protein
MTYEEYRAHMRTYSRETAVMSFVVQKHPDYQALQAAGNEIVPWLLKDMLEPFWHCDECHGFGMELVPTWQKEWEDSKTYPPRQTGKVCSKCNGVGYINSWACMMLIAEKMGDDRPKIPPADRGKHDAICRIYRNWGIEHGYIQGEIEPEPPGILDQIKSAVGEGIEWMKKRSSE